MKNEKVDTSTGEVTPENPDIWFSNKPSKTKQAPRKETDINHIVARGRERGFIPPTGRQPVYGDVSEIPSYEEAFNRVTQAQEAFRRLPAALRDHLGHDPKNLVPFLADEKNREVAEKYGLLKPREKTNEIKNENKTPENKSPSNTPPAST